MIDEVEIKELTETEIKKIAPEVFEEVYDDKAVLQWYQQVDFDNDKRMDIVIYNRLGMGKTRIYGNIFLSAASRRSV